MLASNLMRDSPAATSPALFSAGFLARQEQRHRRDHAGLGAVARLDQVQDDSDPFVAAPFRTNGHPSRNGALLLTDIPWRLIHSHCHDAPMRNETAYHDALGHFFAKNADTSPYNAHTDRPAMLQLAGDVAGRRVLDVGCGAGHYAAELVSRGAEVVGIDGSATLLNYARAHVNGGAELHLHDLEEPLHFADDESFDGAVCALVIHHVTKRAQLLNEIRRVLRPGGWLLVSTTHPTADWRRFGGSYFAHEWSELPVADGELSIRYERVPLETFLGELLDAGFALERLIEPRPAAGLQEIDDAAYAKLHTAPCFLAVRLQRP
ncbi:class I SAM-dependent methyltransferase [Streptosporangium sp. KLBMP 9127]|nr:class I SAM-dependent methyltransferase [Streptosporangium sp. KLBMP 9127]